jgi:alkyl hydroperoxide reductase subunit AhpC
MSVEPTIPNEISSNDSLRYRFFLEHYWDHIDVTDNRIVHTPVYHKKLDFFFKKMIPQIPDTICKYAYELINQMDETSDLFKYTVHHLTYKYETSNIMGMDAVFVCMAKQYYCPADNSKAFWLDSTKLVDLCEKADKTFPLLIGKKAPRLILADTSEKKWVDFYSLPNKYNLLVFWDPDCGHCKKEIPKLTKLYKDFQNMDIDIEFIAIGTNLENEKWRKFIKEKKLEWVNISDFPEANENAKQYIYEKRLTTLESLNFRLTYDIFSTPQIYLVDREKKIIGKKLNALSLGRMIEHLEDVKIDYLDELETENKKEKERIEESKKNNH